MHVTSVFTQPMLSCDQYVHNLFQLLQILVELVKEYIHYTQHNCKLKWKK